MAVDSVKFKIKTWELAANLYFPNDFDKNLKHPAIAIAHPISSCKEQTAAIYAGHLAVLGYVNIAFDESTQCQSGGAGNERYIEDPHQHVDDFHWVVDSLTTIPYVDQSRIGVLRICGGGGYATKQRHD